MFKKIFNFFGYTYSKYKKSTNLNEIIKLRLKFEPSTILIDVGANKGIFAKFFINDFKKIYLIEPNKELSNYLQTIFLDKEKFNIQNFATGNINGLSDFYITNDSSKSLSSLKLQNNELKKNFRNTSVVRTTKVKVKRLDSFFSKMNLLNDKIFLKIDTQGNDFETLIGLGNYISNVKYIKIELPCIKLYKINYNHWDILEYLKKNKFNPIFFEHISRTREGKLIEYDALFEKE